jgi:hypothetical protein
MMDDGDSGFSYAAVVQASRQIRRTSGDLPPSQAAFLQACVKARSDFGKLVSFTDRLIELRQNAEDVLIATGDLEVPEEW